MNNVLPAYLEMIDFIAQGTTPQKVIAFRPSPLAQARLDELIAREKEGHLLTDERAELDYLFQLEHILRAAKGRAEQILTRAS